MFTLLLALAAAALLPGRAEAQPAWSCSAFAYLFQTTTPTGERSPIYQVDLASGASQQIGTTTLNGAATPVNGVGYNTLDNYIYGWPDGGAGLLRIASDGTMTSLGTPAGSISGSSSGDFDNAGHLWNIGVSAAGTNVLQAIDLAPGSPTYGQVIKTVQTATPANARDSGNDIAFINGYFYRVPSEVGGAAHLVRVNPDTGVQTDLGALSLGEPPFSPRIGAVYTDASGYLYASDNASGRIWRINPANLDTIELPTGPSSQGNDGARCATAPIPTITVTKSVQSRLKSGDQFTVALNDSAGRTLTSASTSGTARTASTTNFPVTQGATYTITDAMASGSPDPLRDYKSGILCTNTVTGARVPIGGTAPNWTVTASTPDPLKCTVTNGIAAKIAIVKTGPARARVLTPVRYRITVRNTSGSRVVNARVRDQIPRGLSFVRASVASRLQGGQVALRLGTFRPRQVKTVYVWLRAGADVTGRRANCAMAAGSNTREVRDCATTTFAPLHRRVRPPVTG